MRWAKDSSWAGKHSFHHLYHDDGRYAQYSIWHDRKAGVYWYVHSQTNKCSRRFDALDDAKAACVMQLVINRMEQPCTGTTA